MQQASISRQICSPITVLLLLCRMPSAAATACRPPWVALLGAQTGPRRWATLGGWRSSTRGQARPLQTRLRAESSSSQSRYACISRFCWCRLGPGRGQIDAARRARLLVPVTFLVLHAWQAEGQGDAVDGARACWRLALALLMWSWGLTPEPKDPTTKHLATDRLTDVLSSQTMVLLANRCRLLVVALCGKAGAPRKLSKQVDCLQGLKPGAQKAADQAVPAAQKFNQEKLLPGADRAAGEVGWGVLPGPVCLRCSCESGHLEQQAGRASPQPCTHALTLCPASVLQMQDRTKQFTEDALKPGADRVAAEAEPTAKKATGQLKAGADKVAQEAGEAQHGSNAAGLASTSCMECASVRHRTLPTCQEVTVWPFCTVSALPDVTVL